MNRSSWDGDESELLEVAMQSWSRLKKTWRDMMEEEREVEVKPEMEGDGWETQCERVGERGAGGEPESGVGWDGDTWQLS